MRDKSTRRGLVGALAASAVILALGAAPLVSFGADHLDAPDATPPQGRFDGDINDVYAFEGRNEDTTVLAMTTHPAAGVFSPLAYATDVAYKVRIDNDGDAVEDITYLTRFRAPRPNGRQWYRVVRLTDDHATQVAQGWTGDVNPVMGGGKVFAGLRSDPFFFDLDAFRGAVLGKNSRKFCDKGTTDFFEALNTNAIVLQVPDGKLGRHIGVWGTTGGSDDRIDRMGRPAINTVFNSGDDKVAFNNGRPSTDFARFSGNVVGVLRAFSALDSEGAYSRSQARTLAHVLLPDMVTYDTSTDAVGPLNGRALADDVIDAELNIVTGGFPFGGRNAKGAIPSDCVDEHDDYMNQFPYLGVPH